MGKKAALGVRRASQKSAIRPAAHGEGLFAGRRPNHRAMLLRAHAANALACGTERERHRIADDFRNGAYFFIGLETQVEQTIADIAQVHVGAHDQDRRTVGICPQVRTPWVSSCD